MTKTLSVDICIKLKSETIEWFRILDFGHCDLFGICDLIFVILCVFATENH